MSLVGNRVAVHAYKHDGTLYRSWENPYVVYEDDQMLVLYNKFVRVCDVKQKPRFSREDTFWLFYKGKWLNIQATVREKGAVSYYLNVAGPHLVEEGAVKYIDYDLDFKVSVTGQWKEVDMHEYFVNARRFAYPPSVTAAVKLAERGITRALRNRVPILDSKAFMEWFDRFVKPNRGKYITHARDVVVPTEPLAEAINYGFFGLPA